jgi:hypothetical protein
MKRAVANYLGKDEYETFDLTKAMAGKISERSDDLMANYEFSDITREINKR